MVYYSSYPNHLVSAGIAGVLVIMPTYIAKSLTYKTNSGDIWDLIAYYQYGNEHAHYAIQDANYEHRFIDRFPADVILECPPEVEVGTDLRGPKVPDMKKLQSWRL